MSTFTYESEDRIRQIAKDMIARSGLESMIPKRPTATPSWQDLLPYVRRASALFVGVMVVGALALIGAGDPLRWGALLPLALAVVVVVAELRLAITALEKYRWSQHLYLSVILRSAGTEQSMREGLYRLVLGLVRSVVKARSTMSSCSITFGYDKPSECERCWPDLCRVIRELQGAEATLTALQDAISRAHVAYSGEYKSISPWIDQRLAVDSPSPGPVAVFLLLMRDLSDAAEPAREQRRRDWAEELRRRHERAAARRKKAEEEEAELRRRLAECTQPTMWLVPSDQAICEARAIAEARAQILAIRRNLEKQLRDLDSVHTGFLQRGEYYQANIVEQRKRELQDAFEQTKVTI